MAIPDPAPQQRLAHSTAMMQIKHLRETAAAIAALLTTSRTAREYRHQQSMTGDREISDGAQSYPVRSAKARRRRFHAASVGQRSAWMARSSW